MAKRRPKEKKPANRESSIKGKLVERIVGSLHQNDNTHVERNVFLPAIGNISRTREIDVLITYTNSEGKSERQFVECKNYAEIIDVPLIDAFYGKLHDIGVATERGVFVSIKGFTKGARDRAAKAGIRTLYLTGLTEDRLSVKAEEAAQYVVFLDAIVTQTVVEYACEVSLDASLFRTPFLYDEDSKLRCSFYDLFWKKWREGVPPSTIGIHELVINLPEGYYTPVGTDLVPTVSVQGTLQVTGLVMEVIGQAEQHMLIDQADESLDKFHARATFAPPAGKKELITVYSEAELTDYIEQQPKTIKLTYFRNRLPRIRAYSLYWPVSERVGIEIAKAARAYLLNPNAPIDLESFSTLEGTDIRTAWEPIWDKNPIIGELLNPI